MSTLEYLLGWLWLKTGILTVYLLFGGLIRALMLTGILPSSNAEVIEDAYCGFGCG